MISFTITENKKQNHTCTCVQACAHSLGINFTKQIEDVYNENWSSGEKCAKAAGVDIDKDIIFRDSSVLDFQGKKMRLGSKGLERWPNYMLLMVSESTGFKELWLVDRG